jgi:dTDP-4-dehydrorhamnose 3,5-epimerase
MEIIKTPLKGCLIIKAQKFGDGRGFFMESFNKQKLQEAGIDFDVKQVNLAKSQKNVLRGLHFQKDSFSQGKLVHVIHGAVLDVVVDIRKESETYLQHFSYKLNSEGIFLLIPRGFAHGYLTLEDNTLFQYAVDNYYAPNYEGGIRYDDPKLNIDWGFEKEPLISLKDLQHSFLS